MFSYVALPTQTKEQKTNTVISLYTYTLTALLAVWHPVNLNPVPGLPVLMPPTPISSVCVNLMCSNAARVRSIDVSTVSVGLCH